MQQSNAHADATLQMLQDADSQPEIDATAAIEDLTADRDTYECAYCERLYVRRGKALQCCSDDDRQGGEPA